MGIIGLDHIQLAIPPGDEDIARAFYCGVLEMAELPKPPHLAVSGGCWFEAGGAHVHLGVERDFHPAKKAHPALLVDDLAALAARLEAAGYAYAPGKPLEGYVRGDTHDPFGNRIELMQRV
jgi:catechol 2,3-dioxygenase-like lactoylglutathione lyase family enzyme